MTASWYNTRTGRKECKNYKVIYLLIIEAKIYGRMAIFSIKMIACGKVKNEHGEYLDGQSYGEQISSRKIIFDEKKCVCCIHELQESVRQI